METDIRSKAFAGPEDFMRLNFIRREMPFAFRRHYRQGLRSHVMEVLLKEHLQWERSGFQDGAVRKYPRARPQKMLRVFRNRFKGLEEAMEEIRRVKTVERFLAPDFMARSEEFLVDYITEGTRRVLLCGLQDYIEGEALDPWSPVQSGLLEELASRGRRHDSETRLERLRVRAEEFINRVKQMIREAGVIPDLAGVNNLILTPGGFIKLVDINNISTVSLDPDIAVDDKGYPICDKSVQALGLLEQKLLHRGPDMEEPVYCTILAPRRLMKVKAVEKAFHLAHP